MFERFRKKKQPEGQAVEPDVIPETRKYIVPSERAEKWKHMKYEAKDEVLTFLNTLDRVDIMRFQDAKQFDGTDCEDAVWEAVNDSEWAREWPMGEHEYKERIPSIVIETVYSMEFWKNIKNFDAFVKQVEGIQKKLDKVETLISNAKFELCGKDALKL